MRNKCVYLRCFYVCCSFIFNIPKKHLFALCFRIYLFNSFSLLFHVMPFTCNHRLHYIFVSSLGARPLLKQEKKTGSLTKIVKHFRIAQLFPHRSNCTIFSCVLRKIYWIQTSYDKFYHLFFPLIAATQPFKLFSDLLFAFTSILLSSSLSAPI